MAGNRATAYLQPTEVTDARAVWVNPAGLARTDEASVHLDLTVGDPGARGRLRQLTAGFDSHGLSFAYQRDLFDGLTGHTYRLGLAGAAGGLSLGFAAAYYRGATKATGWDVGVAYAAGPRLTVGGVVANIGQPVVRGIQQRTALVAGLTATPFVVPVALSASGRATSDAVVGYAFSIRWRWVLARLDTDQRLRRGAFAFGFAIGSGGRGDAAVGGGAGDVVGAVTTTTGDFSAVDYVNLYGVSSRGQARR